VVPGGGVDVQGGDDGVLEVVAAGDGCDGVVAGGEGDIADAVQLA
jgi:hypothetical protein